MEDHLVRFTRVISHQSAISGYASHMRAEQGMGRRSVDREVDAKDKRFSRYKGAARARRFGDDTALRVRPRAAWPLADLSLVCLGDGSDLGIVRTIGAASAAPRVIT